MPAHSEKFPWPSYYGHYRFFEDRMKHHSGVISLKHLGDGLYEIVRKNGRKVRIFVCDCYAFGVAEYMETKEHLGAVDAVIINSAWCGYSPEAKRHCRDQKVGIFNISDFMAALNRDKFWNYLNESEEELLKKKGW